MSLIDYTLPGCTCSMGGMGRRADCPHHGERRSDAHAFDLEDGWCQTHRAYCSMAATETSEA